MPTPDSDGFRRDHKCQTDGCPNDFNVILIRVGSSDVDMLCEGCHLAMMLVVLQRMHESGELPDLSQPPATAGQHRTT